MANKKAIFLDLDGLLFDFEGHFLTLFGQTCDSLPDKEMWQMIDAHKTFFQDLPLFPQAKEIYNYCRIDGGRFILTAAPFRDFENVCRQKTHAVRNKLDPHAHIIFVPGGRNKHLYMRQRGDLLIDDMERNCRFWNENGGVAIHHTGDFAATKLEIGRAYNRFV